MRLQSARCFSTRTKSAPSKSIFDELHDVKVTDDMLKLAKHIVEQIVWPFRAGKI